MTFDREKYSQYMNSLETQITLIYVLSIIIAIIPAIIIKGIFSIVLITIPLAIIISYTTTINIKIKIQDMKWKFDLYKKIQEL